MTRDEEEARARAAGQSVRTAVGDVTSAVGRGVKDVAKAGAGALAAGAEGALQGVLKGGKTATAFTGGLLGLGAAPQAVPPPQQPGTAQFTAVPTGGLQFQAVRSGSPEGSDLRFQAVRSGSPTPPVATPVTAPTPVAGIPGVVRQGNTYSQTGESLDRAGVSVVPAFRPPAPEQPAFDPLARDVYGSLAGEVAKAGMRRDRDVAAKQQLAAQELALRQQEAAGRLGLGQAELAQRQQEAAGRLGLGQADLEQRRAEAAPTLAEAKRRADLIAKADAAKTEADRVKFLNQLNLGIPQVAKPKIERITEDRDGLKTERLVQIDPTTGLARYITPQETDPYRMADRWVQTLGLTGEEAAAERAKILASAGLTK